MKSKKKPLIISLIILFLLLTSFSINKCSAKSNSAKRIKEFQMPGIGQHLNVGVAGQGMKTSKSEQQSQAFLNHVLFGVPMPKSDKKPAKPNKNIKKQTKK